ncbi:hypothetical protein ASD19_06305 [Microbacterium sp. Root53]|uniref:hypothetical protein n=1 Tax=Microbacterium sp. Root53 TaxID=1736553 RepID=UPI00070141CF|nr:hypothetical protein [Microbacterium sp. Root53]KQY98817.1 hypothetical protein ASD19_06305 [Microbacterium sp. Root53]
MSYSRSSFHDDEFHDVVEGLAEADALAVLLRGHLWIEVLLEQVARTRLARPDAIDWSRARFEHKLSIAEAVDGITPDLSAAVRDLNRLRNRLAHDLRYSVSEDDLKMLIGRVKDDRIRSAIDQLAEPQLEIARTLAAARLRGDEIEFSHGAEWMDRALTPARAYLFSFVVATVRELGITYALDSLPGRAPDDATFVDLLDQTLRRVTGGLFGLNVPFSR